VALQPGIAQDENRTLDVILLQIEPRIVALTRGNAYSDEIAQLVRIKLIRPLAEKRIENLPSYVRTTVRHEVSGYLRQHKPFHPLIMNEDGEVCGGEALVSLSQGMGDPQIEVEQNEAFAEMLKRLVEAILMLPAMQRRAMICSLREQMDDPSLLIHAFRQLHVDITAVVWPTDRTERQKLQASCSPARRTLARRLNIDVNLYKQRRPASTGSSRVRMAKRSRTVPPIAV
jgi:DNA-directed RNA polymerase specialized sigma24 family protein